MVICIQFSLIVTLILCSERSAASILDSVLEFRHHPPLPKPNDSVVLEAFLLPLSENGGPWDSNSPVISVGGDYLPSMEDGDTFRWYYRRTMSEDYQLLGVGPSLTLQANENTFEGYYNLTVWSPKYVGSTSLVSTVKYIEIMKRLKAVLHIGQQKFKSEDFTGSHVAPHLVFHNETVPSFSVDCEYQGTLENMLFLKPTNASCAYETIEEYPPSSTRIRNGDCLVVDGGFYGCKAANALGEVEVRVQISLPLQNAANEVLIQNQRQAKTLSVGNGSFCLSVHLILYVFPVLFMFANI